jgi:D-alanyl-D-alanine carboxypeptidase
LPGKATDLGLKGVVLRLTIPHKLTALFLSFFLGMACALPNVAEARGKFAALTIDARTGKILFDSDSNGLRHPASLTKMMTLYVLFEDLKAKRISLSTPLRVSKRASSMAPSKLGLKPGSTITVQQAIYALIIKSANDAAATVGENLGGSESAFAQRMTRTARRIGMSRTTYVNASGLPNPRQITTARDQATLGLRLMRDFPQYYPYFRASKFTFNGRVIKTHNRLLGRYPGTDGIKTGYINASGYNLVSSSRRGDKRLVGVVLGGRTGASRDAYMASMLTKAFPKAANGKTVAAKAGSAAGAVDPIKALKKGQAEPKQAIENTEPETDNAALAAVANDAASQSTDEGDDDAAEGTGQPKVLQAELSGEMDGEAPATPPAAPTPQAQKNLPFQVKKAATQDDVDAMSVASIPSQWAVEIGDFRTRKSAADVVAKLGAKKLGGKDSKTIMVKRDGATRYRLLISGYDEMSAKKSCAQAAKLGKDCAVLSPNG